MNGILLITIVGQKYTHTTGVSVKRNLIILSVFPANLLRSHLLKQTNKNKTINLDQRQLIQASS